MVRVLIIQSALPIYRLDFFKRLAGRLGEGFRVYYSSTDLGVLTTNKIEQNWASQLPTMRQLFSGAEWQPGLLTLKLRKGDVLVVSGSPRNLSGMLLLLKARLRGLRTIWWGQYWSSTSEAHRFMLRIALMRMANAVLFYTDQEVEEYRSGIGRYDRRPIGALNNGINVEPITRLRNRYVATARSADILFIGRLTEKAELQLLIQALADSELSNCRLHVVGDGSQQSVLQALSERLGVDSRITWHGGMTSELEISAIANRCRLFVYPGGVGLSLLHAMSYGLPSVVHDDRWCQMPEIAAFRDGQTGRRFRRGSVSSLVTIVSELMQNTSLLDAMSLEAVRQTETRFNTAEMCDRFVLLLMKVSSGSLKS